MRKRAWLWATCLILCLLLWGGLSHCVAGKPNIVLILCDDLGYGDVGFNGSEDIPTPNLDDLARQGTVCTSATVVHPFCGPSRMGLMTGRYPHAFGAPYNLPERNVDLEDGIDVNERLISSVLRDSGYRTGLVGKWHLGMGPKFHPNRRGFDDFYGFLGGGHLYHPDVYSREYSRRLGAGAKDIWSYYGPLEHNGKQVSESEYLTDALSGEAVRFIEESDKLGQPFFLLVAYNAPHTPLEAKGEDLAKFSHIADAKRRTYAAMVHAVDRGVGRIAETLQSTGQSKQTLLVFLSDNGGRLDAGASNGKLRGGKGDTLEGGWRVPMFWHWPGQVPAGGHSDWPISALDLYPTFAGLASAKVPVDKKLDGLDVWQALLADRNARVGSPLFCLRHRTPTNDVGVRKDQWKLHRAGNDPWRLYDLHSDVGETQDRSGEHPEVVNEMLKEVRQWSSVLPDPRWYDDLKSQMQWERSGMPRHEWTFEQNYQKE